MRLALVVLLMAFVAGRAAGLAPMKPRIELFFKTPSELRTRLRELTAAGFDSFNLVNKDKKDAVMDWVDVCLEECADLEAVEICAHFSVKHNAKGGAAAADERLSRRVAELSSASRSFS